MRSSTAATCAPPPQQTPSFPSKPSLLSPLPLLGDQQSTCSQPRRGRGGQATFTMGTTWSMHHQEPQESHMVAGSNSLVQPHAVVVEAGNTAAPGMLVKRKLDPKTFPEGWKHTDLPSGII